MATAKIMFNGCDAEVDYDLEGYGDDEDLVINTVDYDGEVRSFEELTDNEQEEVTMKVVEYYTDQEISSKEADWESEASEECTRRMEKRMGY